ncbi:unnamed protein product [Heterobilharzia americana]|nr:unnamed protein product [Heterobilharzia americana]
MNIRYDCLQKSLSNKNKTSDITAVKRIIFLINGHSSFQGTLIYVDTRLYSDFQSLIEFLNFKLSNFIPEGQTIRRIFTPRGRHCIHSTSELTNGGSYVCAGNEPFRKIGYQNFVRQECLKGDQEIQMSDLHEIYSLLRRPKVKELCKSNQSSKLSLSGIGHPGNVYTNLQLIPSSKDNLNSEGGIGIAEKIKPKDNDCIIKKNEQLYNRTNNEVIRNEPTTKLTKILSFLLHDGQKNAGRKITVVRCNPDGKGRTSINVIMVRRAVHTLGQVMCELTEGFGSRWHNDPIRHLYSLTGREIRSVNELFRKEKVFIASGFHKLFGNIHCELNRSNNVDRTVNNDNNSINSYHQPINYASQYNSHYHHGLHLSQDKNQNTANNVMYLKPEDIRTILSEFWPDHPDPSSVVYQWERRLRNRSLGFTTQQLDTDKNTPLETLKSKQKLSLKVNKCLASNINYSSSDSLLENEKRDSGFDESNNILPKIDEEQIQDGKSISVSKTPLNFSHEEATKSIAEPQMKLLKNIFPSQIPGYVKPNILYPNATAQENNANLLEKNAGEPSLQKKSNVKLQEQSPNTTGLSGSTFIYRKNLIDATNSLLHVNSIVPSLPVYYSICQHHHLKSLQQKMNPINPHLLLPSSLVEQQQQNQQLKKPNTLSKLLSKYHNRLQIGEKVLQRAEQRRDELSMKENRLPLDERHDGSACMQNKTNEKIHIKVNDYRKDKIYSQTINTTKPTSKTCNAISNYNTKEINKIGPHIGESIKFSKLKNQSVKIQQFNISQQIKVNTTLMNTTAKNRIDNTCKGVNEQVNLNNTEMTKQPDNVSPINHCLYVTNDHKVLSTEVQNINKDKKTGTIPSIKEGKNHVTTPHVDNGQLELKSKHNLNEMLTDTKKPHAVHLYQKDSTRGKSSEHIPDYRNDESLKPLRSRTFSDKKGEVKQGVVTRTSERLYQPKNVPNVNATAANNTSATTPLEFTNGVKAKLIANCFTVNAIKKPMYDEPKSFYGSVGVTYISDPEFLSKRYQIGRKLGDGNFAVVKLGKRRDTSDQYAIKIVDKNKITGKEAMLLNEIRILHHCSHPNIVRLYEEFETTTEIWLVMEFVTDGDLFDGITQATKFTEPIAAGIVSDLASALFYLHCRSIVHRDLKPENVLLLRQKNGQIRVKLADFGLAIVVKRNMYTVCGTPTYIAPEILEESGYGIEVDMWALGIITYIMLCGFAPFRSPDKRQSKLFESIKRGRFVFLSPYWDNISSYAKDLISALLVISPKSRLTARETLSHPWVFGLGSPNSTDDFEQRRLDYRKELEEKHNGVKYSGNENISGDFFGNKITKNYDNFKKLETSKYAKMREVRN